MAIVISKMERKNKVLDLKIVCDTDKYMPIYANPTDACMDLKVKIDTDEDGGNQERIAFIQPNETKIFRTGVQVGIPKGFVMFVFPRSSTGFKLNCMLANQVAVIDEDYRDEIKLGIHNFGDKTACLKDGQRVAQFMLAPIPKINLIRVQDDDEFRKNDRGGGIGSTGA